MRLLALIFILMTLSLSACSPHRDAPETDSEKESATFEVDPAEIAPSREAIYVYGEQKAAQKRVTLTFSSQPILLLSGYVRLAGVVRGESPTALVEIGGGGLVVGLGDKVDGYFVSRIDEDKVVLIRGENR